MKAPWIEEEIYLRHRAQGRLADLPHLLLLQCAVYDQHSVFETSAQDIFKSVPLSCQDSFALFQNWNYLPMLNDSCVMAERLMVPFLQCKEFLDLKLSSLDQHRHDTSTIDVIIAQDIVLDGRFGVLPRLVIELSGKNTQRLLLAKINNLTSVWPTEYHYIVLGVTISFAPMLSMVISAYYVTNTTDFAHISEALLWSGEWNAQGISRILAALHCLCTLPLLPVSSVYPVVKTRSNRNHCMSLDGKNVHKVYDYRLDPFRPLHERRRHQLSLKYLNAIVVVDTRDSASSANSGLVIIKYDFIPGSHIPFRVSHICWILFHLNVMHEDDTVHGDIRFSNMLFNDSGEGYLIDYDWSGKAGCHCYPSGFNLDICDSKRHPDVKGGARLEKLHDLYSLLSIMKVFEPEEIARENWTEVQSLLAEAIEKQQNYVSVLNVEGIEETVSVLMYAHSLLAIFPEVVIRHHLQPQYLN